MDKLNAECQNCGNRVVVDIERQTNNYLLGWCPYCKSRIVLNKKAFKDKVENED